VGKDKWTELAFDTLRQTTEYLDAGDPEMGRATREAVAIVRDRIEFLELRAATYEALYLNLKKVTSNDP